MSLAAINVTGPLAGQLLQRAGLADPPSFLGHVHADVAGVPCHVMRLSFTGEASGAAPPGRPVGGPVAGPLWRWARSGHPPAWAQGAVRAAAREGPRDRRDGHRARHDAAPGRDAVGGRMDKPAFIGRAALEGPPSSPTTAGCAGSRWRATRRSRARRSSSTARSSASGSWASPILEKTVMLGWLKRLPFAETVQIDGREAVVTPTPFYDPEGHRARLRRRASRSSRRPRPSIPPTGSTPAEGLDASRTSNR